MLQDLWMRVKCVCIPIAHDLRKAVFLSDTVYVMGPRPSSIVYKVKVNLQRPCTLDMMMSDDFNRIVAELRRHIHRNKKNEKAMDNLEKFARSKTASIVMPIAATILLFVLWEILVFLFKIPPYNLPAPSACLRRRRNT
ncbi:MULTISPECIES: hypothetical protein [unclassified Microcoleus]